MVVVDFSNPFLRNFLEGYVLLHKQRLEQITKSIPKWVEKAYAEEGYRSQQTGCLPRLLAATLDIDEVILSNIHMNSYCNGPIQFYASDYFTGPDGRPWPRGSRLNPLLPGAKELLQCLKKLKLDVFLITGRRESIRSETVENFDVLGLTTGEKLIDASPSHLLMCPDAEYPPLGESIRPFKEARRAEIERVFRIVVNVGDQVSDLGEHGDVQVLTPHHFYHIA